MRNERLDLIPISIHPHPKRQAFYLSSGTCVVIGETARLGDDVTIMQGVTLGGNGKERGDRHPKLGEWFGGREGSVVGWLVGRLMQLIDT